MRKVANACNVSQTAPYRHFKNKDELIWSIGNEVMRKFKECLQQAVDKYPDDPRSQLKEMGYLYIRFFTENPEYLRLIFLSDMEKWLKNIWMDPDSCDAMMKEHPFQIFYEAVERYRKMAEDASKHPLDQNILVLHCWGLVHGISILIARKEFNYQGDYLQLVRKIIWDESFLAEADA